MSESFRFFIPYHCNFCLRIISRIYFLHCCGIITINLQQYRSWLRQYGRRYVSEFSSGRGPLFHLQSAMRAGRESEANFCARSAVRHRVGRVAGGRSAIRNGICPLQTLLPAYFARKAPRFAFTAHDEEETGCRCQRRCRRCCHRRRRHRRRCRRHHRHHTDEQSCHGQSSINGFQHTRKIH